MIAAARQTLLCNFPATYHCHNCNANSHAPATTTTTTTMALILQLQVMGRKPGYNHHRDLRLTSLYMRSRVHRSNEGVYKQILTLVDRLNSQGDRFTFTWFARGSVAQYCTIIRPLNLCPGDDVGYTRALLQAIVGPRGSWLLLLRYYLDTQNIHRVRWIRATTL